MNKPSILNESTGSKKKNLLNSELKDPIFKLLCTEAAGNSVRLTHYFCRGAILHWALCC